MNERGTRACVCVCLCARSRFAGSGSEPPALPTPHFKNHISQSEAWCCFIETSSPAHTKQLNKGEPAGSLFHGPLPLNPPLRPQRTCLHSRLISASRSAPSGSPAPRETGERGGVGTQTFPSATTATRAHEESACFDQTHTWIWSTDHSPRTRPMPGLSHCLSTSIWRDGGTAAQVGDRWATAVGWRQLAAGDDRA